MAFEKTFDVLSRDTLTAFQNQDPDIDISQGSLVNITSMVWAAALFGLYEKMGFEARQRFVSTMNQANLLRIAAMFGLVPNTGEDIDSDFRSRVLSHVRQPPAGGTKLDYQREAIAVSGVDTAKIQGPDEGQAPGNIKLIILSGPTTGVTDATEANKLHDADGGFVSGMVGATVTNTDDDTTAEITGFVDSGELTIDADIFVSGENYSIASRIPSTNLITSVQTAIDAFKPATDTATVEGAVVYSTENITMSVSGDNIDIPALEADIEAYMDNFDVGETLYLDKVRSLAINNGADTVTITAPATDVTPTGNAIILPGTISVT